MLADMTTVPGEDKMATAFTSRDRVLRALAHREPDRVPVDLLATPEVFDHLIATFGIRGAAPKETDFLAPGARRSCRL